MAAADDLAGVCSFDNVFKLLALYILFADIVCWKVVSSRVFCVIDSMACGLKLPEVLYIWGILSSLSAFFYKVFDTISRGVFI